MKQAKKLSWVAALSLLVQVGAWLGSTPSSARGPTSTYSTYTGPFGGYSSSNEIWTDAHSPCGDLSFQAAAGYAFPKGIAVGTSVTLVGIRNASTGYDGVCYDMTGVKSLVVAGAPAPTPTATPTPKPTPKPTPTPTPTPTTVTGSSGSCSTVGSITGLPYCAYAANSTWNQPLPASPAILSNSQTLMANAFANYDGRFYLNPPGSFPHYFTHAGDPNVTIDLTLNYGSSNVQGASVPMPTDVVAAIPPDAHLTVLNASNGDEYDYYQFPQDEKITAGEKISVGFGNMVNYVTGSGWGGATTAAGAALLSGLVTVDEFESGTIHHALAMAPGCNNGAGSVYPATASASSACPTAGAGIPHGSRIWSDLTATQVDALGLDVVSTMVLKALNQYGGFVTDTNGWIALDVRNLMEAPVTPQGSTWWSQNGGNSPALNSQPASFFTTHFHVLQVCVTQGGC